MGLHSGGFLVIDLPTLQYIHPYYVASDLPDLDAAFDDGKRRAILTLERKIAKIQAATRADYESEFISRPHSGDNGGEE